MKNKSSSDNVGTVVCCMLVMISVSQMCNGYKIISTLDDFSGNQLLIGVISEDSVFPITVEGFYEASTNAAIIGRERDLELVVTSGPSGAVFTAGVNNDDLSNSSPHMGSAFTIYQLDGIDASTSVNVNGLQNFDLTFSGSATAFRLLGFSDIDSSINFFIYTPSGRLTFHLELPGDFEEKEYIVDFSNFEGDGDFSDVGAIELQFDGDKQIDVTFSFFGVVGPE